MTHSTRNEVVLKLAPRERTAPDALTHNSPSDGFKVAAPILEAILANYRTGRAASDRLKRCLRLIDGAGPAHVIRLLDALPPAWADHAIASIYALLMPKKRRKRLGAYFTPPHLVDHLITQLQANGVDICEHRLRDPAAGGAAFLVPLARLKVAAWRALGFDDHVIAKRLQLDLIGRELDPELATIANALVRRMLNKEFGFSQKALAGLKLVRTGDSLNPRASRNDKIDHEVGNPPFLRLTGSDTRLGRAIFSEMSVGRLNLYAIFVRRALKEVPSGGLVGYVIPASFLGGPEFQLFRQRVFQLAEVLVIDQIEKRSDVFLDAIQDACFIILRRRTSEISSPPPAHATGGILHCDGQYTQLGSASIQPDGAVWQLPGVVQLDTVALKDWGYRATIGYLVANRQPDRIHKRFAKGRYPLIWAKAITTTGRLDFDRGAAFKGRGWANAPANAPYIIRKPCVVVQRTSSRGQKRRLNAAAIFKSFLAKHNGIIGENHVILLVPIHSRAASPRALAAALNQPTASAQLDRICGSASISARLLEKLPLCKPPTTRRNSG